MSRILKLLAVVVVFLLVYGCGGSQKSIPVSDESVRDSNAAPIFAESDFLIIDIDMMADQFQRELIPMSKVLDSGLVENSVYEMLFDSLLGEDFEDFDLESVPHLKKQHEEMWNDYLLRLFYQKKVIDAVTVDSADVLSAYEEHKERFFSPKKYRARHFVISGDNLRASADSAEYVNFSDEQLDSLARSQVEGLRERALKGANFDTLAIMYSQDPGSSELGGDLGYFETRQMVAPFDSAVENTPIGEISGLIRTSFGWHVIKVEDMFEEQYLTIDSVYDILYSLVREKNLLSQGKHFIDSISLAGEIAIDSNAMQLPDSFLTPQTVYAVINPNDKVLGNDTINFGMFRGQAGYFAKQMRMEFPLNLENKIILVKTIANRFHLTRAAIMVGFDKEPELEKWSYHTRLKYAVSTMRKKFIEDGFEPSDEDLRAYYDAHAEDYRVERPLKVQHIVFADSNLAEHVRDVALSGIEFDTLIDQYYPGEPDIKKAASNLGFIGEKDMPKSFWRAAMITPVGDVSKPIRTDYGFHIIKVLEKNHSVRFEVAKSKIKTIMKEKHKKSVRNSFIESKIGGPPTIHWELFEKLYRKVLPPPSNPNNPRMR
ncbi:MAG: peptidylprolyl isomerase [candidate division Zixibacteria bacterium]|nr:peptidylprolyl isomerase [candidate division Zixibacteria bacterium]